MINDAIKSWFSASAGLDKGFIFCSVSGDHKGCGTSPWRSLRTVSTGNPPDEMVANAWQAPTSDSLSFLVFIHFYWPILGDEFQPGCSLLHWLIPWPLWKRFLINGVSCPDLHIHIVGDLHLSSSILMHWESFGPFPPHSRPLSHAHQTPPVTAPRSWHPW